MKLTKLTLENVMELEGAISFPEKKVVVICGENKAGKSNIIHALRYAFLSKVIRPRKSSGYDELKLVTGKEIAPNEGIGRIFIEFDHGGEQFEIRREIDRYKDNNKILREETDGFRELDFNKTLNKELKAGLLDALFAPDSAMGFNHLNERNIDAIIRELFKEIGNAKVLTKDFKQRIEKLKEEAAARVVDIERDYGSFIDRLRTELENIRLDLSGFERYESGKTSGKISYIADELKIYFDSLEKGELKKWLEGMRNRAKMAEDVEELLHCMDIFASSSLWEGLPTVILEAMACGVPVVATDIPGTNELVTDEHDGLLVQAYRPKALFEGIQQLLTSPALAAQLAKNARKTLSEYSIQSIARQYEDLYQNLRG